ncbi:MAG: 3-oxoacyl-[acyl-carrier-protein] synthase III C-terminal domain-containing protein, partial [Planctomycetota bacterium]
SFTHLGNTGSAALPVTLAFAAQMNFVTAGQNVALLGIGSGINCIMLGASWGNTPVSGARWTNDSVAVSQSGGDVDELKKKLESVGAGVTRSQAL